MKKLFNLEIINSRADIYGNRYFAMVVTRNEDGKTAMGRISGNASNCRSAIKELSGGEWGNFTYTESEIGIREWNRMFGKSPYLGCNPEEINPNIINQMDNSD